ncbi:MAG: hypothetical protein AABX34_00625, partial [Nanoarchaeota archaeon]
MSNKTGVMALVLALIFSLYVNLAVAQDNSAEYVQCVQNCVNALYDAYNSGADPGVSFNQYNNCLSQCKYVQSQPQPEPKDDYSPGSYDYGLPDIPEVEGECVPVDPITGASCPECCDGSADDYQDYPDDELEPIEKSEEEPEEECETPALRDCAEECTVLKKQEEKKCVFPEWRNCRQECAGLPSYPTYEFEDCLTQCDNRNSQDRADYDKCVEEKGTSSAYEYDDDCGKKCEAQNSQDSANYDQCVKQEKATKYVKPTYPEKMETADDKVNIDKINAEIEKQYSVINDIFKHVAGRNAIITSGYRQKTGQKFSYHQTGDAVDLRIRDLEKNKYVEIFNKLRNQLDKSYDVCLEVPDPSKLPSTAKGCVIKNSEPHIHVEYNRRKVEAARKIAELV